MGRAGGVSGCDCRCSVSGCLGEEREEWGVSGWLDARKGSLMARVGEGKWLAGLDTVEGFTRSVTRLEKGRSAQQVLNAETHITQDEHASNSYGQSGEEEILLDALADTGGAQDDAISRRDLIPLKEYEASTESIYRRGWRISPLAILAWTTRQLGLSGRYFGSKSVPAGQFVIMPNLEVCMSSIQRSVLRYHFHYGDRTSLSWIPVFTAVHFTGFLSSC